MNTAEPGGGAGHERALPAEDAAEYVRRMRSLPAGQLIGDVVFSLLNAAQVKLGRRDARLLIDLATVAHEHARAYLPGELTRQIDQMLGQLRLGQVSAEGHRDPGDEPEENDLGQVRQPLRDRRQPACGHGAGPDVLRRSAGHLAVPTGKPLPYRGGMTAWRNLPPALPPHGTVLAWARGCRCDECEPEYKRFVSELALRGPLRLPAQPEPRKLDADTRARLEPAVNQSDCPVCGALRHQRCRNLAFPQHFAPTHAERSSGP